jgi:hypothetical protein
MAPGAVNVGAGSKCAGSKYARNRRAAARAGGGL